VIVGLGVDVVDVARIERILRGPPARAERFLARVFTPAERAYCDPARDRATRYAARFAA
jgi:holo-[acyl-carrier protein] synthase